MSLEFLRPSQENLSKNQLVARLTQDEVFQVGIDSYRLLATPVIFANDLVDFLMLDSDQYPVAVHIFEENPDDANLAVLLHEYAEVAKHLEKLKRLFPHVKWPQATRLRLMFLARKFSESFMRLQAILQIDLILVEYESVEGASMKGLILREKPRSFEVKRGQHLDSLFNILAENVKSDSLPLQGAQVSIKEKNGHEEHALSFFERAKLSEEELVSFLDFEKKVTQPEVGS
jgi:hypothetical protein